MIKKLIKIESDNLVLERLANADVPLWIRFDDEGTIKFNGDDLGISDPQLYLPRFAYHKPFKRVSSVFWITVPSYYGLKYPSCYFQGKVLTN